MRGPLLIAIAAVLLLAPIARAARADPASTLKQQGVKAAQEKNWQVARERFEQSYALDPRPLTLFNLAVAQEHTDRLVEARESYALFLEQSAATDSEQFRKLARAAIPMLDKAIPTLQLRPTGLAAGDAIELDGRAVDATAPLALDPGSHTVVVRRGREPIIERSVTVARGARDELELAIPPPPAIEPPRVPPPAPPPPALTFERPAAPPPRPRSGMLRSPWFWGITAAVVVAAAGTSWYYLDVPTHDPTRGTLGPTIAVP